MMNWELPHPIRDHRSASVTFEGLNLHLRQADVHTALLAQLSGYSYYREAETL
jgi:hypothetical protein